LSALLVDKNLLAIAAKLKNLDGTQQQNSIEQQELLDSSINVIRARTLSILRRLKGDRERKSSVIRFLIEADIVRKLRLPLSGADLSGADLSGANLTGTNLSRADLSRADLTGTNLTGTNLSRADLSRADLSRAKNWDEEQLSRVELRDTRLPEGCKLDPNRDASE
jgi:uncharacterized protein YjbI with pentapeptide repeats